MLGGPVSDLLDAARKIQQQPNDAAVQRLLFLSREIAKARARYGNERCQIYEDADFSEANAGV